MSVRAVPPDRIESGRNLTVDTLRPNLLQGSHPEAILDQGQAPKHHPNKKPQRGSSVRCYPSDDKSLVQISTYSSTMKGFIYNIQPMTTSFGSGAFVKCFVPNVLQSKRVILLIELDCCRKDAIAMFAAVADARHGAPNATRGRPAKPQRSSPLHLQKKRGQQQTSNT